MRIGEGGGHMKCASPRLLILYNTFVALPLLCFATPSANGYDAPQQQEVFGSTGVISASKWECEVSDPLSCDQTKSEVCRFKGGNYVCGCPEGVKRSSDGRCIIVNECDQERLNDCAKNARCIDQTEGYTCECNVGFVDRSEDKLNRPGRICQKKVNECANPYQYDVDCSENAVCMDTDIWYTCVCRPGYTDISTRYSLRPGRKCVEIVNECTNGDSDCSSNADCIDQDDGYSCKCHEGYVDVSPNVTHYPGRQCALPSESDRYSTISSTSETTPCPSKNAPCPAVFGCSRDGTSIGGAKCFNQCAQQNECHKAAVCSNTYDGYKCQCKTGYLDISPDPVRLPGRNCIPLINECADHTDDCSPFAMCDDTRDSYICTCNAGFTDVSSRYGLKPGRKCTQECNKCSDKSLNSCDENADCVTLVDGYTCKCYPGYVDVSSNANLPPGRVCTLQTSCPAQPTDLVFLIDGSGSIGSKAFNEEVLRFVKEFIELFEISPKRTRVGVVQYSDRIRHEFDLDKYSSAADLQKAIREIEYMTGLTRTGAAIDHVVKEAFSEAHGARPKSKQVSRVAIVITDGRSQDDVSGPSASAKDHDIQLFAVGVTDHTLDSELLSIVGSRDRFFHVEGFKDLNTRLRSVIQKVTCPDVKPPTPFPGPCDTKTHSGCDRSLNQICVSRAGQRGCECPDGFEKNPITNVCGGEMCNPEISSSCPHPEICRLTPFGNYRCACDTNSRRDPKTGACKSKTAHPPSTRPSSTDECDVSRPCGKNEVCKTTISGSKVCECLPGFQRDQRSDTCIIPGTCDPSVSNSCDQRKREECLPDGTGQYSCQCPLHYRRHSVTGICLYDECAAGKHDCDRHAICKDTDESYICACRPGYLDESPNPTQRPGRVCKQRHNECEERTHNCSVNAVCIDLPDGFLCRCKDGYVDFSPNPLQFAGTECRSPVDECADPSLNTCSENAYCIDTKESYTCQCVEGYVDVDGLRNPGRICQKEIRACSVGKHDCDVNARCVEKGSTGYDCVCNPGFMDKSPDPRKPGRICIEQVCLDPTKNDCHPAAICTEVSGQEKYRCECRNGYYDANPSNPGRNCKQKVNECQDINKNDCDPTATCQDLPEGYTCSCPSGAKDVSPDPKKPGRKCSTLINECENPSLNTCSPNADCIDRENGYECRCKSGYRDKNLYKPGTDCEFETHPCQPGKNDCSKDARCVEKGGDNYECICNAGFVDKSTNPNKPGRTCKEQICADSSKHDCHPAAICTEVEGPEKYRCKCRDGYVDLDETHPGRMCKELLNECLDASLNDCDPTATCHDLEDGYTCTCPISARDVSPDKNKPGRKCNGLVNECQNPHLNNCSRFADCIDKEDGYECRCKSDYHDNNPKNPGTDCRFIINECESPSLNDCSKHAECIDTQEGYECKCKPPYVDMEPSKPGRSCLYNECEDPNANDCSKDAECIDTDDGYTCQCKPGFYDDGKDPLKPGRICIGLIVKHPEESQSTTPPANLLPCGSTFCHLDLDEVCIGGEKCSCRPGQSRKNPTDKCVDVFEVPIELRIEKENGNPLTYSSEYGNPSSPTSIEITDRFAKDMGDAVKGTPESQKYVSTGVNFITNPKVKNSTWNRGLLFNGTVDFSSPVDKCEFWSSLLDSLKATNYHLGGGSLTVSPDSSLLNPCRKDEVVITGVPCGNTYCRPELGEECIAEKLCGCPNGQKRNGTEGKCRQVESWHIPLWVIRNGSTPLEYTDSIANPQDSIHKQLVTAFEKGIQDSYDHTPLRKGFVVAEVNDIVRPSSVNKTFDRGIIYNFTTSFVRGSVETPSKVYTDLYEYIVNHNNYEVGNSEQYISPNQANPFDVCFKSDCHPHAICKSSGRTYTCECPADFRDLDVSHPGHRCIPLRGYNECEKPEDNECDVNARCIDEDYLYRCECVKPWVNAAKPGQIPGSVCQIDYCSDVNFCPANTTCKNENDKAQCVCLPGYIDIGKAATSEPQRGNTDQKNLEDVHCVKTIDVNECALGLHNCSAVAICTDLPNGYKCECPEGYTDGGSPPGRVCAALLCGLCNGHGDCVTNPETNNITCACVEGYTGEFCEVAPSSIPLLLWLLLALLFLLLTLCCCLYFCLKTRCFGGGVGHKKLAESSEGTLSIPDYWTIPRAQIKRPDQMAIAKRREDEQVANAEALSRGLYDEDYRDREARDAYGRGYDDRDGRRRYGDYYNDRGSIISGSSGSEDENIVKKVTTEVTRKEITTRRVEGQEGGTTTYKITSSTASGGGGGFDSSEMHTQSFGSRLPIETEAEQFAASSSDHYMQDGAAGGDIYTTTNKIRSREAEGGYDDYVSDDEAGIFDRTTKYTTERDYLPSADGRSGRERLRNTMLTTSTANETRYF